MGCLFSVRCFKYIYKYVYKGHDRTTMEFGRCQDEVKLYLDSCYVSRCKAIWRLFHFPMHEELPNVVHLQIHLPQQQMITWNAETVANLQDIMDDQAEKNTNLTGYFKANELYPEAKDLLYQVFPSKFVWIPKQRKWQPRQQKSALGCMYYAHPNSGE